MKTITVDGKEYKLEFGFDAVEVGDLVQKMFEVKSVAQLLLCHSVFFPEKNKNRPLLRTDFQTVLSEVPVQFPINGSRDLTIQDGKDQPDIKVKLFDHEIIV